MTSTHASKPPLDQLPTELRSLYLPQAKQPERFVHGNPVKGRNEPCAIGAVAWVVHRLHETASHQQLAEQAWQNTVEVFRLDELK